MNKVMRIGILAAVIVVSLVLSWYQLTPPDAEPGELAITDFSVEKAMSHIVSIAQKPHPTGSKANGAVRDYIINQLADLGMDVKTQKKRMKTSWIFKRPNISVNIENIFATLRGTGADNKTLMLVAHYDSVPDGPGAADDGAGVATILETIRAIQAGKKLKNNIMVLFTDGEEVNLLGAKAFVEDNRHLLANIAGVLNFEARGNKGPVIMFETSTPNEGLMKAFKKVAPNPIGFSFSQDVYKYLPNLTDFTVFKTAALRGLNFAVVDGFEAYHTQLDNVANFDKNSLLHYGSYALSLTRYFGNLEPYGLKKLMSKEDAVYFPFLKGNLVLYSQKFVFPLTIFIILLLLIVILSGVKANMMTPKGILLGCLYFLTVLITGLIIGKVYLGILSSIYHLKIWGFIVTNFKYSDIYMMVFLFLFSFMEAISFYFISRRIGLFNLMAGASLLWAIGLATTSFFLKGASYLLAWPLLFNAAMMGYMIIRRKYGLKGLETVMIFIISVIPNIFLLLPAIYIIYLGMTIGIIPLLTILITFFLMLAIPNVLIIIYGDENEHLIYFCHRESKKVTIFFQPPS